MRNQGFRHACARVGAQECGFGRSVVLNRDRQIVDAGAFGIMDCRLTDSIQTHYAHFDRATGSSTEVIPQQSLDMMRIGIAHGVEAVEIQLERFGFDQVG